MKFNYNDFSKKHNHEHASYFYAHVGKFGTLFVAHYENKSCTIIINKNPDGIGRGWDYFGKRPKDAPSGIDYFTYIQPILISERQVEIIYGN